MYIEKPWLFALGVLFAMVFIEKASVTTWILLGFAAIGIMYKQRIAPPSSVVPFERPQADREQ